MPQVSGSFSSPTIDMNFCSLFVRLDLTAERAEGVRNVWAIFAGFP